MDTTRLTGLFDPLTFRGSVAVIGLGATGSAVALQLAKMGLPIYLIDPDTVDSHNISNQTLYGPSHVGQPKVAVAAEMITLLSGVQPRPIQTTVTRRSRVSHGTIFLCVDSNASRLEVLLGLVPSAGQVMYDVRIGVSDILLYKVQTDNHLWRDRFAETLHSDEDAIVEVSPCGTRQGVMPTAAIAASLATTAFLQDNHPYASGNKRDSYLRTLDLMAFKADTTIWS